MAEIAPAGGGPNRLFVVLAIGLAALLVIGLVGIGGWFVLQTAFRPAVAPTAKVALASPTRAEASATAVPTDAATPTLVLSGGASVPVAQINATSTPAPTPSTDSTGQLPQSGLGENLLLLAGGVVLVMIIFVARRVRTA